MGLFKIIPYLLIGLLWYTYASMGKTPCERIDRGTAPIRTLMDGLSWAISPWVGPDAKFEVLKQQLWLERKIREIAAQQVYETDLVSLGCVPAPVKQASDSVPLEMLEKMNQNDMSNEIAQRITETVKSHAESEEQGTPTTDSTHSQILPAPVPAPGVLPPNQQGLQDRKNTIQIR